MGTRWVISFQDVDSHGATRSSGRRSIAWRKLKTVNWVLVEWLGISTHQPWLTKRLIGNSGSSHRHPFSPEFLESRVCPGQGEWSATWLCECPAQPPHKERLLTHALNLNFYIKVHQSTRWPVSFNLFPSLKFILWPDSTCLFILYNGPFLRFNVLLPSIVQPIIGENCFHFDGQFGKRGLAR